MATEKPIILYTVGTPNGHKVSIFLEELKAAYGLEYDFQGLSFSKNEQKEGWFLKINPNGRIPAIVDRSHGNLAVFETGAILLYLAQHYDKEYKFSFPLGSQEYSEALQWLFFANAGVGPMQGQATHFYRYAAEKIQYGIDRYQKELSRLYGVLDGRLAGREYLVGEGQGKYSIVDINVFTWVRQATWAGLDSLDSFPNLKAWEARIDARSQVLAGRNVPTPAVDHKLLSKEEQEKKAAETSAWVLAEPGKKE
jgi:glutathione S-transferase